MANEGGRIGSDDTQAWETALRRVDRDYKSMVEKARAAGWRVRAEGRHVHLIPKDPTKRIIPVPSSGGDKRHGLMNFRRDLRQAGLEI